MYMKKKHIGLACLLLLGSISGYTQRFELSLDDAVSQATGISLEAKERQLAYKSSEWRYKAAKAGLFPQLSLGGNIPGYSYAINSITQPDGTVLYIPQSQAISNAALTLRQTIAPTGATLHLSSGIGRIDLFNTNAAFWQAQPFMIGLSQPLGRANMAKWNWRREKLNYSLAQKEYLETRETLASKAANTWFDTFIADLQLKNAANNVQINDTLYTISKGRFDLGKIAETELLQVELSLLNARNTLRQAETNYKSSFERLTIVTGLTLGKETALPEPADVKEIEIDPEFAIGRAVENRSEYVNLEILRMNALIAKRDANWGRFVSGDLNASFGLNQTGLTFRDAYRNPVNSQVFSIGFAMPLYGASRMQHAYREARDRYEATLAQVERNKLELTLEVKTAVMELKQLEQSVIIAKRAYEVSEKRFELSKNRFLVGKIDITNLTIAQNEKDQALINYANTLRSYHIARYTLRRLTLYDFERNTPIRF